MLPLLRDNKHLCHKRNKGMRHEILVIWHIIIHKGHCYITELPPRHNKEPQKHSPWHVVSSAPGRWTRYPWRAGSGGCQSLAVRPWPGPVDAGQPHQTHPLAMMKRCWILPTQTSVYHSPIKRLPLDAACRRMCAVQQAARYSEGKAHGHGVWEVGVNMTHIELIFTFYILKLWD